MFKFLTILMTFFLGKVRGAPESRLSLAELTGFSQERVRKLIFSSAVAFAGLFVATIGFLAAYFEILQRFDQTGFITLNAVSLGGLFLIVAGSALSWGSLRARRPNLEQEKRKAEEARAAAASPLEVAITALVQDFLKTRELDREIRRREFEMDRKKTFTEESNEQTSSASALQ